MLKITKTMNKVETTTATKWVKTIMILVDNEIRKMYFKTYSYNNDGTLDKIVATTNGRIKAIHYNSYAE